MTGGTVTGGAGTFADGQSAVGLRLFDASSVANKPLNGSTRRPPGAAASVA